MELFLSITQLAPWRRRRLKLCSSWSPFKYTETKIHAKGRNGPYREANQVTKKNSSMNRPYSGIRGPVCSGTITPPQLRLSAASFKGNVFYVPGWSSEAAGVWRGSADHCALIGTKTDALTVKKHTKVHKDGYFLFSCRPSWTLKDDNRALWPG